MNQQWMEDSSGGIAGAYSDINWRTSDRVYNRNTFWPDRSSVFYLYCISDRGTLPCNRRSDPCRKGNSDNWEWLGSGVCDHRYRIDTGSNRMRSYCGGNLAVYDRASGDVPLYC